MVKSKLIVGKDVTDVQKLDWHSMISLLTGEVLIALGSGTRMRDIVAMIARAALHWQEGQRQRKQR